MRHDFMSDRLTHHITCLSLALTLLFGSATPSLAAAPDFDLRTGPANTGAAEMGQAKGDTGLLQFVADGHVLGFGSHAVYLAGSDHALKVEFVWGAAVQPIAVDTAHGTVGTTQLNQVTYPGIWPGIDVLYQAAEAGIAESTYIIHPGGAPSSIALRYNTPVTLLPDGGLRFQFERGYLQETAPVAWQVIDGVREPVEVQFALLDSHTIGFTLGSYDSGLTLFIDPVYKWHTFYGPSHDWFFAMAVDAVSNDIFVMGTSPSAWNGPDGELPLHGYASANDIVLLKLNSAGAYQWHTFYGSSSDDEGHAIAIDTSGDIYVTGVSYAGWNGPESVAPLNGYTDYEDIFVLNLDSEGGYQWHTFYGSGSSSDYGEGITADTHGGILVAGWSDAGWNGPDGELPLHAYAGANDIVMLKLNSAGAYQWHTFYGSGQGDFAGGIGVDQDGNVWVTGNSEGSWNGPGDIEPLEGFAGACDIFVLELDTDGAYQLHTFYGSDTNDDYGDALTIDGSGNVYVTGSSGASWNGPDDESPVNGHAGNFDIVILKLDSAGLYQWHGFYGAAVADGGSAVVLDESDDIYVGGYSYMNWDGPGPTTPLNSHAGSSDIVTLKLDSAGAYQWHTFYGSGDTDYAQAIAVGSAGDVYLTGISDALWNGPEETEPLNDHPGGYAIAVLKLGESEEVDVTLNLATGWNLISVPVIPSDAAAEAVFWDSVIMYTWYAQEGVYVQVHEGGDLTDIVPGRAYWVKVTDEHDGELTVTGTPVDSPTTYQVELSAGWNMVGSVFYDDTETYPDELSVVGDPDTDPLQRDAMYWWDAAAKEYVLAEESDPIEPGIGYWLASTTDCTITMAPPPV